MVARGFVGPLRGLMIAVVVAATQCLAMWARRDDWFGVWAQADGHFGQSMVLTMPVLCSAAAWHTGAFTDSSLREFERTSAHETFARSVARSAAIYAYALLGLVVAYLGSAGSMFPVATFGGPDLAHFGAVAALAFLAVAVGERGGSLGHRWIGAPIAGVTMYVVLAWAVVADDGFFEVLTPMNWQWMTLYRKAAWVSLLQAFLVGLISLAVLALPSRRRLTTALGVVAAIVGVVLLMFPGAHRAPDERAARLRCAQLASGGMICVPSSTAFQVPQLAEAISALTSAAPGLVPGRVAFVDDQALSSGDREALPAQLKRGPDPRDVWFASQALDLSASVQIDRRAALAQLLDWLVPPRWLADPDDAATSSEDQRRSPHPVTVVRRALYSRAQLPFDGSAYAGAEQLDDAVYDFSMVQARSVWLTSLSDRELAAWLSKHASRLRDGSLTWSDFAD